MVPQNVPREYPQDHFKYRIPIGVEEPGDHGNTLSKESPRNNGTTFSNPESWLAGIKPEYGRGTIRGLSPDHNEDRFFIILYLQSAEHNGMAAPSGNLSQKFLKILWYDILTHDNKPGKTLFDFLGAPSVNFSEELVHPEPTE
jgi:hypothetical protein